MNQKIVESILLNELNFSIEKINKLKIFHDEILSFNKKYNLISRSTEHHIWSRHILDSAQIVKFIDFNRSQSLADLGSGAGFPGIVLAIFNSNSNFHVKLYEKSSIKCKFLSKTLEKLNVKATIIEKPINETKIYAETVVCRAYRKLNEIMNVSREIIKVNHKLIILKGKNAINEINELPGNEKYRYELSKSITDKDSKIIIFDMTKKNEL